ncbi:FecR family protein [Rhizobium etli bv. mimosae str. IE4771]|uniref:FecR family protein n=1 Tax=Rhizobium etli bv. mimosae str. IE4771 TaxID=1432050 RepID=A0A060IBB7_RHIET|nr:FecR domain-containing protein [Rhizobium sp. IE4771]AIC28986.1 FecR family protein [Rhizobium sp. IE4771]
MWGRRPFFHALLIAFCSAQASPAAEPVGQAVLIKTEVTGQAGPIAVNTSVHRDERIRTSPSGLGQFVFRDGTKLAVGWGSSVVIDKYVFDDTQSVRKLTIKAAKGTFRWVSGNSKSSAYQILTPAGTIGVRGTAFDFYVGPDGTTAVVLLNGAASFCGPGGCRQLQQRCDCVVAKPNGDMTPARRVDPSVLDTLGNLRALPFLSGNQRLAGGIGMLGGCNMASVMPERKDRTRPPPAVAPAPQRQDPPQRQAEPQKERPNKPEKPHHDRPHHDKPHHDRPHYDKPHHDKPDRPDKHEGHGRHDDDGKPGNHGLDHREHGRHHDGDRDHRNDRNHDRNRDFKRGR